MVVADRITRGQLEEALRLVDPRVRLVASRVLRRLAAGRQKANALGFHRVHRRSLTIATADALHILSAAELGVAADTPLPDVLILIEEPDRPMPRDEALTWAWRRLFHARIHADLDDRIAAGGLGDEEARRRIEEIGRADFAEIRSVLEADAWLVDPADDARVYEEFAAVFLEFRHFVPALLSVSFPGMHDLERVAAVLARDIDGPGLLEATRPAGAPDPAPRAIEDDRRETVPVLDDASERSERRYRWLIIRADRARGLGNLVRSGILRTRASRLVGPSLAGQARSASADDMARLAVGLAEATGVESIRGAAFRSALSALLARADRGHWNVEARLLYDLQSVCIDQRREIFQLDLKGWLFSAGRRPLKRPLPNQKSVRISKHLRRAAGRLAKTGVNEPSRATLAGSLQQAMSVAEGRLRERFGPLIARCLERAGIAPTNLPEAISSRRMTEELLDRVVQNNFLTMGEVRDAVARGDLRQPDLTGPREFVRGDRVLRANRRLRVSLEGVYHPGEIYLRALQRASLLMFGTRIGRWLVRYVAIPYGGALGALITAQELIGFGMKAAGWMGRAIAGHGDPPPAPIDIEGIPPAHAGHFELANVWTVGVLGTVILLLLHEPRFFAFARAVAAAILRALKLILIDAPAWVFARPSIRSILASRAFDLSRRLLLQPAAGAALTFAIASRLDGDRAVCVSLAVVAFALSAVFLGTPFGRDVEDVATDAALRGWRKISVDLVPGLVRFIIDLFARLLEALDRLIYAVDEKLRFRSGERRSTLAIKAALGTVWGVATYLVRIAINLFVEPTINPIKHFPTVTVAAKMVLPYLEDMYKAIVVRVAFLGKWGAGAVASLSIGFLPGLAGFIVWELKENWKLFEANRPKHLRPVMIGHHGETMRRLLLPGFHSGTIPKLFSKLREAERLALATGRHAPARKAREAIEHVEVPIRHFLDRGFAAILVESGRFAPGSIAIERVHLATNRVEVHLVAAGYRDRMMRIAFENDDGRLIVRVCDCGFRSNLGDEQRVALDAAAAGMSARAGAEVLLGDCSLDVCFPSSPCEAEIPPPGSEPARHHPLEIPWKRWVAFWGGPVAIVERTAPRGRAGELSGASLDRGPRETS